MKKALKVFLIITIICIEIGILAREVIYRVVTDKTFITKHDCAIYVLTKSFKEIDINVQLGLVFIETGPNYAIKIEYSKKIDEIDWQIKCDKLKIFTINQKVGKNSIERGMCPKVTIFIPKDKQFNKIYVRAGVGRISIDELNAKEVELDSSTGGINLSNANIGNLTIKSSMGGINLSNADIENLTVDQSMGKVSVTGDITESIDIKNSMGKTELNLKRLENYYDYDLDCSMGKVKINGHKIKGQSCGVFRSGQIINNNKAGKPLKIKNTMGNIGVDFKS